MYFKNNVLQTIWALIFNFVLTPCTRLNQVDVPFNFFYKTAIRLRLFKSLT